MRSAYLRANVPYSAVDYLECHATGTQKVSCCAVLRRATRVCSDVTGQSVNECYLHTPTFSHLIPIRV